MSGTMNGIPFARREFKAPFVRGSKFARVAAEAPALVDWARANGLIKVDPAKLDGTCPRCGSPSRSGSLLCAKCRATTATRANLQKVCPTRTLQCACGAVFETKQPKQFWCTPSCKKQHRKKTHEWTNGICVDCNQAFIRTRSHAMRCRPCVKLRSIPSDILPPLTP